MREKFMPFIKFSTPRLFRLPGQSLRRAAGRRAGALFFARHQDCFIVTQNFVAVYLDLVPLLSVTVTLGYSAIYRDWQKTRHRDTDGT